MGVLGKARIFIVNLFKFHCERGGNGRTPERVKDDWLFESLFFDVF